MSVDRTAARYGRRTFDCKFHITTTWSIHSLRLVVIFQASCSPFRGAVQVSGGREAYDLVGVSDRSNLVMTTPQARLWQTNQSSKTLPYVRSVRHEKKMVAAIALWYVLASFSVFDCQPMMLIHICVSSLHESPPHPRRRT